MATREIAATNSRVSGGRCLLDMKSSDSRLALPMISSPSGGGDFPGFELFFHYELDQFCPLQHALGEVRAGFTIFFVRGRVGFAAGCPFDLFHCAGVQLGCRTQANFGVVDGFGFLQVVHLFVGQVVHEGAVGRESVQEQQVFVAGLFRWGLGFGGGRVFRGEFAREHFRGIVFWHTLIIRTTSAYAENT